MRITWELKGGFLDQALQKQRSLCWNAPSNMCVIPGAADEKSHQWQGTAAQISNPGLTGMVGGSLAVGTGLVLGLRTLWKSCPGSVSFLCSAFGWGIYSLDRLGGCDSPWHWCDTSISEGTERCWWGSLFTLHAILSHVFLSLITNTGLYHPKNAFAGLSFTPALHLS